MLTTIKGESNREENKAMVNLMPLWLPMLVSMLLGPGWVRVSAQQSDPCVDYTELSDPWRSTSNTDQSEVRCDRDIVLQGWYLLVDGNASVLMPNSCVPRYRCSTHASLWLNGAHPTPAEGVVSRQVCGHWEGGCCDFTHSIQVKACPGGYTVYQLVHPTHCELAYCAVSTERIGEMLASLSTNKVTGMDQIPARFIKDSANVTRGGIAHIINLSMQLDLSSRGALPTQTPQTQTPAPTAANSVVGLLLKASALGLNATAVQEEVLKRLEAVLTARGLQASGLQVTAVLRRPGET